MSRTYAGLDPSQREAQRRGRLLSAGLDLFGTLGFSRTTVERLCTTAGVSTKSFYLQYPNKERAFLDVYDAVTSRSFAAAIRSLEETDGSPMVERIPAAVLAYVTPSLTDVRAARIAFVEVMGVSPAVEARRLEYRESLVTVIQTEGRAAVARGEITDRDFRFATMCLAGGLNAAAYDWVMRRDREDVTALEKKIARLSLDLLAG